MEGKIYKIFNFQFSNPCLREFWYELPGQGKIQSRDFSLDWIEELFSPLLEEGERIIGAWLGDNIVLLAEKWLQSRSDIEDLDLAVYRIIIVYPHNRWEVDLVTSQAKAAWERAEELAEIFGGFWKRKDKEFVFPL